MRFGVGQTLKVTCGCGVQIIETEEGIAALALRVKTHLLIDCPQYTPRPEL